MIKYELKCENAKIYEYDGFLLNEVKNMPVDPF